MKILLAVDCSTSSNFAIDEVARLPLPADTIVQVVSVDVPIPGSLLKGSPTAFDELVKQQRLDTIRRLNEAVAMLNSRAANLTIQPKLLEGSAKDAIVNEAERWGADLIVLGSHGYGPFRRFFLGSVSLYVANNAPCSVLIARCKPDDSPVPEAPPTKT